MANKKHLALLKQGERAWNQWRKTNHEIKPDLSGANLKGKDLTGTNFSYADIRGANFSGANLKDAELIGAKAGLQRRWATGLVTVSWLLSGLSGIFSQMTDGILTFAFDYRVPMYAIIGAASLIVFAVFFILTVCKGLAAGLRVLTFAGILIFAGTVAGAIIGSVYFTFFGVLEGAFAGAMALGGTIALSFTVAVVGTVIVAIAVAFALAVVGTVAGAFAVAFAVVGVLTGTITGALGATGIEYRALDVTIVLLGAYIGWRGFAGDEKHAWIRSLAIALAAVEGTSFRNANLTDANFTEATLKSTDFRNANLTRTRWHQAKKLDRVRTGRTYLQNKQVQQLVITGKGENKNFDCLDLRGLNLLHANLENASFIDADLYQANLSSANLSRAILVRTNFERADLRGACLTGSCIQDWTISRGTKLDGIICDYVYLKWVNEDKRDQMPPRGKFKAGGFVTFVRYILETVELYHEQDINPRLALTVLQKMSRDYDKPFDIVALGKKGERVFIQVKVSENIIRENFKDDYYSRYDNDLKLWSGKNHQLPPAVNSFIERRISQIALERTDDFVFVDATYVAGNYTEIKGEVNMSGDRNIHMGSGNYNERIDGNYIQGNYYAPEQKQTLAEAAAEIQQLLTQLQSQGCSPEDAQHRAANDLATKAKNDSTTKEKLVKWGQSLGDTAAQTTVSEAAKEVVKLALRLSGVPLP